MPSAAALTESEVNAAIQAIAANALSGTRVIPRYLLAMEDGENPSIFRSSADSDRVNALMFWRSAILRDGQEAGASLHTGPAPSFSPARLASQGRMNVESWVYTFRFYYQVTATGSDASNTEAAFQGKVDTLNAAFAVKPKLGLDSYRIDRHGGLIWPLITILSANDQLIDVGHGQLTVVVHRAATPA
jgi:hypothetical protein